MSPVTRSANDISLRPPRIGAGAAIALVYLIVGVAFWLAPDTLLRSLVGQVVTPWAHIWNTLYIVGGSAVLAGRVRGYQILGAENFGVCLLAAGWALNALCVWSFQGFDPRSLVYVVFIWWAYSQYRRLEGRA